METIKYPCIMKSDYDIIALFIKDKEGIVLQHNSLPYLSKFDYFDMRYFKPYKGDFVLPINEKGYPKLKVWCTPDNKISEINTAITLFIDHKTGIHLRRTAQKDTCYSNSLVSCEEKPDKTMWRWRDYNET